MTTNGLSIGALAKQSGTNTPTIRYYEEIDLMRRPARNSGGHRTYVAADIARLTFIRRCREFGFPIDQVKTLVTLLDAPDRSCFEARDLAQARLADVRVKLSELKRLEKTLAAFVHQCISSCAGGPGPDCAVLQDLTRLPQSKRRYRAAARRSG